MTWSKQESSIFELIMICMDLLLAHFICVQPVPFFPDLRAAFFLIIAAAFLAMYTHVYLTLQFQLALLSR